MKRGLSPWPLCFVGLVGDDEAGVVPLAVVLRLVDDAARLVPRAGGVVERGEDSLLLLRLLVLLLCPEHERLGHPLQHLVPRQADHVSHVVAVAPAQ